MADDPFAMPRGNAPALDRAGRFATFWHRYLGGIERLAKRQAVSVAASSSATTVPEVETKLNEVIAALKAANLMKDQ